MRLSVLLMISAIYLGCAHYPDVRPGTEYNTVMVHEKNEKAAFRNAMGQATDYCDDAEDGKRPIVLKERKMNKGSISKIVDGVAKIFDGEEQAESINKMAGMNTDKPYEVILTFKCK